MTFLLLLGVICVYFEKLTYRKKRNQKERDEMKQDEHF